MSLKIENGVYALDSRGIPIEIQGLEELTQEISLALTMIRGSLPMAPELGSSLAGIDLTGEDAEEQAFASATEALLIFSGVTVRSAEKVSGGINFRVDTPLGETEVLYGNHE